jgi:hypothetical protein
MLWKRPGVRKIRRLSAGETRRLILENRISLRELVMQSTVS